MLLIDADYFLYKTCLVCETEIDYGDDLIVVSSHFSDVQRLVTNELNYLKKLLKEEDMILFFSDHKNFRKDLYPDYKGQRNRKKPCGYKRAISWLRGEYQLITMPELEADDALGIFQTKHAEEDHILVSPDKDLRQVPGRLFVPTTEELTTITKEAGDYWHLIQAISGDQTDGYSGCPGYGAKKAETLFKKEGASWSTIVRAYEKAGLTEADALLNARLAKILQQDNYDESTQRIIPWCPTSDQF
jgi:5'-3' exonuclease